VCLQAQKERGGISAGMLSTREKKVQLFAINCADVYYGLPPTFFVFQLVFHKN